MVTKFLIFCETTSDCGKVVRYVNDCVCDSVDLQDRLVHLSSIGVKVFKVVSLVIDEEKGFVKL